MKKVIAGSAGLVLLCLSGVAQNSFIINGKINADTLLPGKIYMYFPVNNVISVQDSAVIRNNTYQFTTKISDGGVRAVLNWGRQSNTPGGSMVVWAAVGEEITVSHRPNFSDSSIVGGHFHRETVAVREEMKDYLKTNNVALNYISKNPSSWLSYILIEELYRKKRFSPQYCDSLYETLSGNLKQYPSVRMLGDQLKIVGKTAPDFTLNDPNGKPVSLSSFRGKFLLLDFWASWCVPCREENKFVKEAYDLFSGKGFDVLSVSMDSKVQKDAWIKAIKEDGLTWTQVSELSGMQGEIVGLYYITSIPRNVLIDPDGKIIASNLRGPMLINTLKQLIRQ